MARITPCLENGKTALINILDDDEVGFGSTEFIVWRAKADITDSRFVYYLSQSPDIRDVAVKSMVGTSGRQRVQQGVLNNYEIDLPDLDTQREIAATLSALDDKIAVNTKLNHNLEQTAQAIFAERFGDCKPDGTLGDICDFNTGRIAVSGLTNATYVSTENMLPNRGGVIAASSLPTVPYTTSFVPGDVLISNIRPYFKKIVYCGFSGGALPMFCASDPRTPRYPRIFIPRYAKMLFSHTLSQVAKEQKCHEATNSRL
jgi:type I restriction enzyme S subunit